MDPYDIGQAFAEIEAELIASMIRNMKRHRAEETKEGFEWTQWQAQQLKALEAYKKANKKKYGKKFRSINNMLAEAIKETGSIKTSSNDTYTGIAGYFIQNILDCCWKSQF